MANTQNGTNFNLWLYNGTSFKVVALSSSCKFGVDLKFREVSSKDSGIWGESAPTRLNWSVSVDALYSPDGGILNYDWLYAKMITRTSFTVNWGVDNGALPQVLGGSVAYSGNVFISKISLDAKDNDGVSFSVDFETSGPIQIITALPGAAAIPTGSATAVKGTGLQYVYTVAAGISGATNYLWTLPVGGNVISGWNTNTITVTYSAGAASGNVNVQGQSAYGSGAVSPNLVVTVS